MMFDDPRRLTAWQNGIRVLPRDIAADVAPGDVRAREQRALVEGVEVNVSSRAILGLFGIEGLTAAGETVTIDSALGVPAVWAAVNFLSGALADLPLQLFRRTATGRERVSSPLSVMLRDAVNDETSSFDWRKYTFDRVFTGGRAFTFIERAQSGRIINFWPLDPNGMTIEQDGFRKRYKYRDGSSRESIYDASEIIDLCFMMKDDLLSARSPIYTHRETIALAQAVTKYGARFFSNGGVPPFAITGPFQSAGAMQRAADDLASAISTATTKGRQALALPAGHELKSIGEAPEKSQLVELHRFLVEQIARIYSLPPTFLQDLTHGTFSNTEQQDLQLVKHTLTRWIVAFEQEMNLKLFGRSNARQFVKVNVDGLLRGDFKTRMEGNAQAINTGQRTPNEAREKDELPPLPGGDRLYIQGAMIPAEMAGEMQAQTQEPPASEGDDE